jgi:hypothetical protein
MRTSWVRILLLALPVTVQAQTNSAQHVIPPKNVLALTPENFCLGFKNMFAITKQSFQDEANLICPNQVPAPLFATLVANAYTGTGTPFIQTINNTVIDEQTIQLTVAYAMKIPKPPVPTLLGEEKNVPTPYVGDPLTIRPKFGTPVPNTGDADTAFTVEQRTTVRAAVEFDEVSVHDLKLYRMHPNNFDFFAAVRTLRTPSEQFKKAVVLRGVMRDPANANASISITVLNFVMNSRDEPERVTEAFMNFIGADLRALYAAQSK